MSKYYSRQVTLSEATKSMFAYTQLNDSILSVIKSKVDDPEVSNNYCLLHCNFAKNSIVHCVICYRQT